MGTPGTDPREVTGERREPAMTPAGRPSGPYGPRDPGDDWVELPDGRRFWGLFGAAGLLAYDRARDSVLLQLRAAWGHQGGTWGIPGGALREGEPTIAGAIREAHEEAAVPADAVAPVMTHVFAAPPWSYTTVLAEVTRPFVPSINDRESDALEWVPLSEIEERPLHSGFAASWPLLRPLLAGRPVVIVDAANVVGSRPDGWWRDRPGATLRLRDRLSAAVPAGVPAGDLEQPGQRWFPSWELVVEGEAGPVADEPPVAGVAVIRSPRDGDSAIVERVEQLISAGVAPALITVVTSDRGLAERVTSTGALVRGAGWLLRLLDGAD